MSVPDISLEYNSSQFPCANHGSIEYARVLKNLTLENVLCFSFVSIGFNQRINQIIGSRGSGKSSVQRAIFAALGAENPSTLKKLVKAGSAESRIQLVLNNSGGRSYQYANYGSEIIIERRFNATDMNSICLKSEKGEIMSCKEQDLEEMLTFFKIKTYLISIINRGNMSIVLTMKAEEKYNLFLEVTNLEIEAANEPSKSTKTVAVDVSQEINNNQFQQDSPSNNNQNSIRLVDIKTKVLEKEFQKVLFVRNLSGKLIVDHTNGRIVIMTDSSYEVPGSAGGKAQLNKEDNLFLLSDEMKSFFAVAFLIALWKVADQPFLSIDDFDLFMGSRVTLNIGIYEQELLIALISEMACEKPECQFVISTPPGFLQVQPSPVWSFIRLVDREETLFGMKHSRSSPDGGYLFKKARQREKNLPFARSGKGLWNETVSKTSTKPFAQSQVYLDYESSSRRPVFRPKETFVLETSPTCQFSQPKKMLNKKPYQKGSIQNEEKVWITCKSSLKRQFSPTREGFECEISHKRLFMDLHRDIGPRVSLTLPLFQVKQESDP